MDEPKKRLHRLVLVMQRFLSLTLCFNAREKLWHWRALAEHHTLRNPQIAWLVVLLMAHTYDDKVVQHGIHTPADMVDQDMQPCGTAFIIDFGHFFILLSIDTCQKRYLLASTVRPYRGLTLRAHRDSRVFGRQLMSRYWFSIGSRAIIIIRSSAVSPG